MKLSKKKHKRVTLRQRGEEGLIRLIRGWMAPGYGAGVIGGIGDDAAVLRSSAGVLLATVDILVEGVHFRREFSTFQDIGYKALAVNVSDIAAMGGTPLYALISLVLPRRESPRTLEQLYRGLREAAREYGVSVVGGNLSSHRGGLVIDVTLLGQGDAGKILYRGGAKAGDVLLVTGNLGEAALGLEALKTGGGKSRPAASLIKAHRRPRALLQEGRWLAESGGVHAMIDLSDGLAKDLGHLCRESKLGAVIYDAKIPLSASALRLAARLGLDPLSLALGGGEDYQLLLAVDPKKAATLQKNWQRRFALPLTAIGQMQAPGQGIIRVDAGGRKQKLAGGYRHF